MIGSFTEDSQVPGVKSVFADKYRSINKGTFGEVWKKKRELTRGKRKGIRFGVEFKAVREWE